MREDNKAVVGTNFLRGDLLICVKTLKTFIPFFLEMKLLNTYPKEIEMRSNLSSRGRPCSYLYSAETEQPSRPVK